MSTITVRREREDERRALCLQESEAYAIDEEAAAAFDKTFPPREKKARPSQEMFYILSHASLQ